MLPTRLNRKSLTNFVKYLLSFQFRDLIKRTVNRSVKVLLSSQRRTVDFVIAGTQKGGTSALDAYLRMNPEICMAGRKEVHFFDNESVFRYSPIKNAIYHTWFNPEPRHRVLGECTPIYMYWADAPKRIWKYNPRMKIIIILRNPTERAFSHWNMERDRNAEKLPFFDALVNEQERCREALPYQHRVFSYIDSGFYTQQLRKIWRFFPKEQTLVLRNEDLRHNPNDTLERVAEFLGVHRFRHMESKDVHSKPYIFSITQRGKEYLRNIYEYEIKELERILCWDCSDWLV